MIRFEKVSFEQFKNDYNKLLVTEDTYALEEYIRQVYDDIKLPERATVDSAGYDFFAPFDFEVPAGKKSITIPTGIRFITDYPNIFLLVLPRSGQGFKYGLSLMNTAGVIDSDYQYAGNEGHIMAKLSAKQNFLVKQGQGYMQGIITPYYTIDNDLTTTVRSGGFGSTDKK